MLDNFDLLGHVTELESIKDQIDALKKREGDIKDTILSRYESDLKELYKAKDEPFGAVNIQDGIITLTVTTPKKIEWDQDKLEYVFNDIRASGHDPEEYIDIQFKVREAAFKNWPSSIQDAFIPARTVQSGTPSMKWKIKDA